MDKEWIDQNRIKRNLAKFFKENKDDLSKFGLTVNQTFEAFVFVSVARWYLRQGWDVKIVNPKDNSHISGYARLKFNTRGRPDNYTYFVCKKGNQEIQIRHQLRIATYFHVDEEESPPANICLDAAVIESKDLAEYETDHFVENKFLITFGEAKHMSAFAELIANFIGLVHELRPELLKRYRTKKSYKQNLEHLAPFLYVSGILYPTARGIKKTIENRGYNIDIYDRISSLTEESSLPLMEAPSKSKKQPMKKRKQTA